MRICSALLLIFCLIGCNRGLQNKEAVRQGVIDHLRKSGLNMEAMDVSITAVQYNGNQADATASIAVKGNGGGGAPMVFKYHLEQQGDKWVYVGRQDTGASPHGGGAMPGAGAASPHGDGAMPTPPAADIPPGGGAGAMPSPQDLPPTKKK